VLISSFIELQGRSQFHSSIHNHCSSGGNELTDPQGKLFLDDHKNGSIVFFCFCSVRLYWESRPT
jgi:hypothetical protein